MYVHWGSRGTYWDNCRLLEWHDVKQGKCLPNFGGKLLPYPQSERISPRLEKHGTDTGGVGDRSPKHLTEVTARVELYKALKRQSREKNN
jgi:hypothetical protein